MKCSWLGGGSKTPRLVSSKQLLGGRAPVGSKAVFTSRGKQGPSLSLSRPPIQKPPLRRGRNGEKNREERKVEKKKLKKFGHNSKSGSLLSETIMGQESRGKGRGGRRATSGRE